VKPLWSYRPHYNLTLSSTLDATVPVVRTIDGERTGMMMRWPLIHIWVGGWTGEVRDSQRQGGDA
jgi:hypothetical protein